MIILNWGFAGFICIVVNRALSTLHGGHVLEIKLTVPLRRYRNKDM